MKQILILLLCLLPISSQDLKKYFDEYNVKGSFVMYNLSEDSYFYFDSARCYRRFIPASTFKIPNSIIGLETGVIKDENFVIPWDSVVRQIDSWNHDMDLKTAIKVSCVPYYQELARRVGEAKMQEMLSKLKFGNNDISGGIDMFWLDGGLRISQFEQIDFLKRLYEEQLPVSKRTTGIVKKIIILDDTKEYVLRGKTGWGVEDSLDIGWLVGWVEKDGKAYFYATNMESRFDNKKFPESRKKITEAILKALGIIS